jgi:hypothetical protein
MKREGRIFQIKTSFASRPNVDRSVVGEIPQ